MVATASIVHSGWYARGGSGEAVRGPAVGEFFVGRAGVSRGPPMVAAYFAGLAVGAPRERGGTAGGSWSEVCRVLSGPSVINTCWYFASAPACREAGGGGGAAPG